MTKAELVWTVTTEKRSDQRSEKQSNRTSKKQSNWTTKSEATRQLTCIINNHKKHTMTREELKQHIRCIPDFPKPGIQFQDISTLVDNAECLKYMVSEISDLYKDKGVTKVVGVESRGFLLAPAVAINLGAGAVMARKPGKLPGEVRRISYQKEYGEDTICMVEDSIKEDDVVLIHDDLLATGGSMLAVYNLVKSFHPKKIYLNFIIELKIEGLHGRDVFEKDTEITTLLTV